MAKKQVTQAELQYMEAIERIEYYKNRIAALEAALREIKTLSHQVPANAYTFHCDKINSIADAALKG